MSTSIQDLILPPALDGYTHTLKSLDPVVYQLLHYISWSLNYKLGTIWSNTCNNIGLTELAGNIVGKTIHVPLSQVNLNQVFKTPILQVQRISSEVTNETNTGLRFTSTFQINWILPPFIASQINQLDPFLNGVAKCILTSLKKNYHDAYTNVDGYLGGLAINADFPKPGTKAVSGVMSLPGLDTNQFSTVSITLVGLEISSDMDSTDILIDGLDGTTHLENPVVDPYLSWKVDE